MTMALCLMVGRARSESGYRIRIWPASRAELWCWTEMLTLSFTCLPLTRVIHLPNTVWLNLYPDSGGLRLLPELPSR